MLDSKTTMPTWVTLRDLPRAFTFSTVLTGLVLYIMTLTAPSLLLYQAATEAGWTAAQTQSWLFAVFLTGGFMQLLLSLGYRQPIATGLSALTTAFLVKTLPGFTFEEAVGAYLLCGALLTVLAYTGLFTRMMNAIPQAIVMGMLAGALLRFETDVVQEMMLTPWLALPIIVAWLAAHSIPRRIIPPVVIALLAGIVMLYIVGPQTTHEFTFALTRPIFYTPTLTLHAFFSIAIPLFLLTTSQNASAIAALWAQQYRPPVQMIAITTGVFTLFAGALGGHGMALGPQRTAVGADSSTHPDPARRYGALVIDAVLMLLSAFLATTVVGLFGLFPRGIIRVIAG